RVAGQIFEYAAFAPGQRQRLAVDFRITPVHIDAHRTDLKIRRLVLHTTADSRDAGKDLAHVHRLAHDIVHARFEQPERVLKAVLFAESDHRSIGTVAYAARPGICRSALPEQKCPNGTKIIVRY